MPHECRHQLLLPGEQPRPGLGLRGAPRDTPDAERCRHPAAGAGRDAKQAAQPVALDAGEGGRVLVFAYGSPTSGVLPEWAATPERPGVNFLPELSGTAMRDIAASVESQARDGDIIIVSIHWGGNWGYSIPREQIDFAHGLIDQAGVDIVHGHSAHHVKGLEVYKDRLILYGCGDFLNDYEGIGGQEWYRPDLALMYFPTVEAGTGGTDGAEAGADADPAHAAEPGRPR